MAESYTRADIEEIVRDVLLAQSKEVQRTGTVSALEPLTVSLDGGGEAPITLVDPSLSVPLEIGLKVKLDRISTGYMITGLAATPGAASIAPTELPDNLIGKAIIFVAAAAEVPAGWAICNGGTYAGKLGNVITPNLTDGRFLRFYNPSGGPAALGSGGSDTHNHGISTSNAHNHGGNTGTQNQEVLTVTGGGTAARVGNHDHPISSGGAHDHTGATANDSTLPPWRALVPVMWIGLAPTATGA